MINFSQARIIDVINASEQAAAIFGGEDTYTNFTRLMDEGGRAAAVMVHGKFLGVIGITKPEEGTAAVAAILTDVIKQYPKESIKALRHLCDIAFGYYGVKQLNIIIKDDFPNAEKYAHIIGFKKRGADVVMDNILYRCYWRTE